VIEILCQHCGKAFEARKADVKRGFAKYCSFACSGLACKARRKAQQVPNLVCAWCKANFYRQPGRAGKNSRSGLSFCSRQCKDQAQQLGGLSEIQPDHYGTLDTTKEYRLIAFRHLPNRCNRCGYDKFPAVLEVHHQDRNRENNKLENLEILCPTCHEEHHFLEKTGRFGRSA
jgi:5-methylcytosine-specific restriction endonuclease McrA